MFVFLVNVGFFSYFCNELILEFEKKVTKRKASSRLPFNVVLNLCNIYFLKNTGGLQTERIERSVLCYSVLFKENSSSKLNKLAEYPFMQFCIFVL